MSSNIWCAFNANNIFLLKCDLGEEKQNQKGKKITSNQREEQGQDSQKQVPGTVNTPQVNHLSHLF